MNLDSFTGQGSTPSRRRFWDRVTQAVIASQKVEGKNVSVAEHQGMGTIVNVARERGGVGTGACCLVDACTITTESDCTGMGGTYHGDGSTCPASCTVACDGSVTVNASLTGSVNGTCPSGIVITTTVPGTKTGTYPFTSESSLGTAIYCTFGGGGDDMEITNGNQHLVCGASSQDTALFISMRLVQVVTAGDIEGINRNAGDWCLLVGGFANITGFGTCAACFISASTNVQVFPDITNTITFTISGVTANITLIFSV